MMIDIGEELLGEDWEENLATKIDLEAKISIFYSVLTERELLMVELYLEGYEMQQIRQMMNINSNSVWQKMRKSIRDKAMSLTLDKYFGIDKNWNVYCRSISFNIDDIDSVQG